MSRQRRLVVEQLGVLALEVRDVVQFGGKVEQPQPLAHLWVELRGVDAEQLFLLGLDVDHALEVLAMPTGLCGYLATCGGRVVPVPGETVSGERNVVSQLGGETGVVGRWRLIREYPRVRLSSTGPAHV